MAVSQQLIAMSKLFYTTLFLLFCCSWASRPGPNVIATIGEVWPKPQHQESSLDYFLVSPHSFSFKGPDGIGCPDLLNDAFTRYWNIISSSSSLERRGRLNEVGRKTTKRSRKDKSFLGTLESLVVELANCENENIRPAFQDDENYTLVIDENGGKLSSETLWGVLRGLETFTQLIHLDGDASYINVTTITDFPRFSHRGLHLDTSRHFMPMYIMFQYLDAMAYNKFNVFHWHITDDQSFPYKSVVYPLLSEKGAYHPVSKVYQQSDISRIIEYARVRGIRVIPEFDTPGHTASWGVAYPELLTTCYTDGQPNGELGPMDPTKENTYQFLTNLFKEIVEVFPDAYFHIGGDEVDFGCWQSNPDVTKFMEDNNITTYEGVENYFIQKVVEILDSLNSKYLVWEEVFVNGVTLPNTTVVHVWKDLGPLTLASVTEAGKYAIFSSCWYLDHLANGGDWRKFYACDPQDFPGVDAQKKLVLGGEACMWSEAVNEHNVMSRVWPRASAAAEKLWSAVDITDADDAAKRLEEHACRMNHRGIAAQPPNGPGVCL